MSSRVVMFMFFTRDGCRVEWSCSSPLFYFDLKMHQIANEYNLLFKNEQSILDMCVHVNLYLATPLTLVD